MFEINSKVRFAVGVVLVVSASAAYADVLVNVGGTDAPGITSSLSGYTPAATGWYGVGGQNPPSINGMDLNFTASSAFTLSDVQAAASFGADGNIPNTWQWYLSANLQAWNGTSWNSVATLSDAGNPSGAFGNDLADTSFNMTAGAPLALGAGAYRVEFDINSCSTNYSCSHDGRLLGYGIVSGLNDLETLSVDGIAPVPEPESYAMLLAGLGLLGFMARRRKQQPAA